MILYHLWCGSLSPRKFLHVPFSPFPLAAYSSSSPTVYTYIYIYIRILYHSINGSFSPRNPNACFSLSPSLDHIFFFFSNNLHLLVPFPLAVAPTLTADCRGILPLRHLSPLLHTPPFVVATAQPPLLMVASQAPARAWALVCRVK